MFCEILIVAAMSSEVEAVKACGFGESVVVVESGIGKVDASMAATEAILKYKPKYVINTGLAGALAPLQDTPQKYVASLGETIIADKCACHDLWCGDAAVLKLEYDCDPLLVRTACDIASRLGIAYKRGLVLTGDQFFISLEEDARIRKMYPEGLSCDMESSAVARVCEHFGIPFVALRLISDIHTSSAKQEETYNETISTLRADNFTLLRLLVESLLDK